MWQMLEKDPQSSWDLETSSNGGTSQWRFRAAAIAHLFLAVTTRTPGVAFPCRKLYSAGQPGCWDGLRGLRAPLNLKDKQQLHPLCETPKPQQDEEHCGKPPSPHRRPVQANCSGIPSAAQICFLCYCAQHVEPSSIFWSDFTTSESGHETWRMACCFNILTRSVTFDIINSLQVIYEAPPKSDVASQGKTLKGLKS